MTVTRKKLIEVALPVDAINAASAREKAIRHGHPSTLHLWWARRPLAAARAVIFAQMVDDPSACPEEFPTEDMQQSERQRLFRLIEQLVLWENTANESLLQQARDEIWKSWRRACEDNARDPQAGQLFDPAQLPPLHDPFAGGGALPLEAQRLGLETYASDLNPVATLICKAMIEIPPRFAGRPPINPESRGMAPGKGGRTQSSAFGAESWRGAAGLAADVRHYGKWMRDQAERRIGHLYPKVHVTSEMIERRPDLKPYLGKDLTVIAWLWARTVHCPNPGCGQDVPLIGITLLSQRRNREVRLEPLPHKGGVTFSVNTDSSALGGSTKVGRGAQYRCPSCGSTVDDTEIRTQGRSAGFGHRMTAIAAQGNRERVYLSPEGESIALGVPKSAVSLGQLAVNSRHMGPPGFGLTEFEDLFTARQLTALVTLSGLVEELHTMVLQDAQDAGENDVAGRAAAIATYLAMAVSKSANRNSALAGWMVSVECPGHVFSRSAMPMSFDYAEANLLADTSGSFLSMVDEVAKGIETIDPHPGADAHCLALDARDPQGFHFGEVLCTDPPYYDNVPYADIADFFYVWLRQSVRFLYPDLMSTMLTPKSDEMVADAVRHGGKQGAASFFESRLRETFSVASQHVSPTIPGVVFYSFKQTEANSGSLGASGWETMLEGLFGGGFMLTGTWPLRTERAARVRGQGSNALASSIVLVCRPRPTGAQTSTRTEFLQELSHAMREALPKIVLGEIAPVDLAQASVGPGMAVYSKYAKVLRQDGNPVTVREALQDINNAISAYRTERSSSFDPRTRFCLDFYDQFGFASAEFDDATVLARAQAVGVDTLENEHLLVAERGKAWLVQLKSYPVGVAGLERQFAGSAWEACMRLAATLEDEGESATAALARELGEGVCARARELAVWLYTIADARKRSQDALAFNALDASWPEIQRLMAAMDRGGQQGRFA